MTLAPPTTVIPAQAETRTHFDIQDAGVLGMRSAACVLQSAIRTPVAACLGPGLRRDDDGARRTVHNSMREVKR